ncbi:MAG: hypothetical protein QXT86_13835 [Archaeoglobaceae archaeon]
MTKRKWKWEEVWSAIKEQGYGYLWHGTVETYESWGGARYTTAYVIDDVPYIMRYFPHRDEQRGYYTDWEAELVILSPKPFRVKIKTTAYEDKVYRSEREETAEKIEGYLFEYYLNIMKPRI